MAPAVLKVDTDRFLFTSAIGSRHNQLDLRRSRDATLEPYLSCYEEIHCQLIVSYESSISMGGQDGTKIES